MKPVNRSSPLQVYGNVAELDEWALVAELPDLVDGSRRTA
jgi:hypothetical protein